MNESDYISLIFEALALHRDYLPEFFDRQLKIAISNNIEHYEFYARLKKALYVIENKINDSFSNRKSELYICKSLLLEQGKIDDAKEVQREIIELDKEQFPLNANQITNRYTGQIHYSDILKLRTVFTLAHANAFLNEHQTDDLNIQAEVATKERPSNKHSFKYHGKPDQDLPELFKLMKEEYRLIAPETSLDQFRDVLTSKPIESIKPVKWHQPNASELLYFILSFQEAGLLSKPSHNYKVLIKCFIKPNGSPFVENFKALKANISNNLSEEKRQKIDKLKIHFC